MPITVGSNIASLRAQRRLAESSSKLASTFEKLSSGLRINKASDDAAGLALSDSLKADARVYLQGVRNLNDGISLLNIADAAVDSLANIVTRLQELAEQAANGTYGAVQRKALDQEAQALSKEYARIAQSTTFNGRNLLNGSVSSVSLQAGSGANSTLLASVGGAIGDGTFGTATSYAVGSKPNSVEIADLNGDGIQDLAIAEFQGRIRVLLGNGGGTFTNVGSFSVGNNPSWTGAGDFNGDGILDLASTSYTGDSVSILIGNGDGTFQTSVSYASGDNGAWGTIADLNGDGISDLVSADAQSASISVFLGNGDGTLSARVSYATGTNPWSVAAGDFNGDGYMDLVSADYGGAVNAVSVFLNQGDGTFSNRVSFAAGTQPYAVTTGDFNGDGYDDIVTSNSTSSALNVLLSKGDGTFETRTQYSVHGSSRGVSVGDFNGDGNLDLVSADESQPTLSVLLGTGSGSFGTRTTLLVGTTPMAAAAGDLNGDGVSDLVSANYGNNTVSVLIGNSKAGSSALLPFSLKTALEAREALTAFRKKQDQLAAQRGEIGAYQSRIAVATNVLQISSENFKAAESRIRDADIAQESAEMARLSILQSSAAAVLAQANLQPGIALRLLEEN